MLLRKQTWTDPFMDSDIISAEKIFVALSPSAFPRCLCQKKTGWGKRRRMQMRMRKSNFFPLPFEEATETSSSLPQPWRRQEQKRELFPPLEPIGIFLLASSSSSSSSGYFPLLQWKLFFPLLEGREVHNRGREVPNLPSFLLLSTKVNESNQDQPNF